MGLQHGFGNLPSITLTPDLFGKNIGNRFCPSWKIGWKSKIPDAIHTTLMLQDGKSQLLCYPRFSIAKDFFQSPDSFSNLIQVSTLTPSQAALDFAFSPTVEGRSEILVPSPRQCILQYTITNQSDVPIHTALEWFCLLRGTRHISFSHWKKNGNTALYLHYSGHHLLISIVGPTKIGQHSIASLTQHAQIEPHQQGRFFIIIAIEESLQDSEKQLIEFNSHNWDSFIARQELLYQASQMTITSENPQWNTALRYSQIQAERVFRTMSEPEIIKSEQGDQHRLEPQAFSNALPLFSFYHQWQTLGIQYAETFQERMNWFLTIQQEDGQISWCVPQPIPSLMGNCFPVVAELIWQIFETTQDTDWLQDVYPKARKFVLSWFLSINDKDQDGCPEWQNPYQAGISDAFLFKQNPYFLHPYIYKLIEHPGLLSYLITEFDALSNIAEVLQKNEELQLWVHRSEMMNQAIQKFYNEKTSSYQVLDYFTHRNEDGSILLQGIGEYSAKCNIQLEKNTRIHFKIILDGAYTKPIQIKLIGKSGELSIQETLVFSDMIWIENQVDAISKYTYTLIENISFHGLKENEAWTVQGLSFAYQDISLLIPLINNPSLKKHVDETLTYHAPYGFATIPPTGQIDSPALASIAWNSHIIEKLLEKKYLLHAATLFSAIFDAASLQMNKQAGLYACYDCQTAQGYGEVNSIHGTIPQRLLLQCLGIKHVSVKEINVTHFNPFSELFTVQYKGMKLLCNPDSVEIHYRGFVTRITQPGNHRIHFTMNAVK